MSNSNTMRVAPRLSAFESRVQKLDAGSGIEIWLIEDYTLPMLSLSFAFKGGATQDPVAKPGVAAMLAGLLGKGAGLLDAAAFQQALDDDAVEMSFGAGPDNFSGQLRTMSSNRSRAFDLLAMAVRAPRLDADALERYRDRLVSALKQGLNNPRQVADRCFNEAYYGEHPYARPAFGEIETVPSITRDDLVAMRERVLARNVLKVACVGAIDPVVLRDEIERVFGALPQSATLSAVPDVPKGCGDSVRVTSLDVPQSTIRFGRPGLMYGDPDFDAATVVNYCFGSGMTSRLFKEVREKRGLCYSIGTGNAAMVHAAVFSGSTATSNERVGEVLAVIRDQMKLLADEGIAQDELERAKRFLTGSYALQFDTSGKIAGSLCQTQLVSGDISRLDTRNASIDAVSVEDAARTARRLIGNGDMLVTIAGKPVGV
jgi:zinc protease